MRRSPLKALTKKWIALACGWAFILLGIVGLFVPILPGILFFALGLLILSTEYLWASNILTKLVARFPSLAGHLIEARKKARLWMGDTPADSA
ncbi:MAG TPA: PGPGW domain-containing protein [Terriglobales bacterium]